MSTTRPGAVALGEARLYAILFVEDGRRARAAPAALERHPARLAQAFTCRPRAAPSPFGRA